MTCAITFFKFSSPRIRALSTLHIPLDRFAPLDIHPEVHEAIHTSKPVVALETALVTHGMPFPTNLETARSLESIVRSTGSIPATIGIIGGRVKIGLESLELGRLADTKRTLAAVKVSRRDIGPALALKRDGGTTCSATLIFAALAGIKVFATGGLGGVHRGGHNSMDISADLHELTRCPVGLVSAGVKSILDIGRTLEYLETLGVPVLSYGPSDDFPAFFAPKSGFKAPWNINDPQTAAQILLTQRQLGMTNGVLFGLPIPHKYETVGQKIQQAVEQAVAQAEKLGISKRGKEVTPWLLKRVEELTSGQSLVSNIALIQNTALVGGQIAVQYAKLVAAPYRHPLPYPHKNESSDSRVLPDSQELPGSDSVSPAALVVIGCTAIDISAQALIPPDSDNASGLHSTSPGTVLVSLGGVGRNIAEAAHRVLASQGFPCDTALLSPVGDDVSGSLIIEKTRKLGMRTDGFVQSAEKTAVCNLILDRTGGLISGVADMDIAKTVDENLVLRRLQSYCPRIVVMDGNLSPDTLRAVVKYCYDHSINAFFEPTSVVKSAAIIPALRAMLDEISLERSPIAFASPNLLELAHIYQTARSGSFDLTTHPSWWNVVDNFSLGSGFRTDLDQLARQYVSDSDSSKGTLSFLTEDGVAQMVVNLLPFFQHLVIKCGNRGVLVGMRISGEDIASSSWSQEQSNPSRRFVVAHGNSSKEILVLHHFPAPVVENIANVTGAGDTLVGVLLARLVQDRTTFLHPATLRDTINTAQRGAALALQSTHAVSPLLSQLGKQ